MSSVIHLTTNRSTDASPIAFFVSFANPKSIDNAKNSFYTELDESQKPITTTRYSTTYNFQGTTFPVTVDRENETVTAEYEIQVGTDEQEWPMYEWKSVVYSFKGELNKLMRSEYEITTALLKNKLAGLNKRSAKELLGNLIDKLTTSLKIVEGEITFESYREICVNPYHAIVRWIYSHYKDKDLAPDPQRYAWIQHALAQRESTKDIYKSYGFSDNFIQKILFLRDQKLELIFPVDPVADAKINLKRFVDNRFSEINPPIKFTGHAGAASYLISELSQKLRFRLSEIEKAKVIYIGGVKLIADSCYTEHSRLQKRRPELKFIIDTLISEAEKS